MITLALLVLDGLSVLGSLVACAYARLANRILTGKPRDRLDRLIYRFDPKFRRYR